MLPPLYEESGALRLEALTPAAQEVMHAVTRWLRDIGRGIYLPLDLMIVLLERGHSELGFAIAGNTIGTIDLTDVLHRLRELGREIEDRHHVPASLERDAFSRSFARIIDEAWEQAQGRASGRIDEQDLMRAIMWRAEVTESASVRWAIKRLAEGGGDRLFDSKSQLKREVFDDVSWGFLQAAMQLAARSGTPFLGTPHLIASFCSVRDSIIWRAANNRGLEPSRLREELLRIIGVKPGPLPDFILGRKTLTPRMVRMLSYAMRQVREQKGEDAPVGERHLVEAFLHDGGSSLELVQALGLEGEMTKLLGDPRVLENALDIEKVVRAHAVWDAAPPTPTLDLIGRDLTRHAREGKLPKIIGRDRELQRVINVLLRREQRNPLLSGEAGVGKTALAVALAQRIADGNVPAPLQNQRVVEINGASLMSGTSYRGELENRIKNLLVESSKGVILFIDEAHAVFAPRTGNQGPAEIPNHFKSALASGEIAVVGATTEAEYRRWIDQDPALKRRFERIEIREPNTALTLEILRGLARSLEKDYEVTIGEDVLKAALEHSVRYLPEQRLPDKAKKLLMDAAIAAAHPLDAPKDGPPVDTSKVDRRHVAQQVSYRTGIPIERLVRGQDDWWSGLEKRLGGRFMGQEKAISLTARNLIAGRLRPSGQARPLAVFGFFGPSGTGKGTLARILAQEVFGDPRAFIRLDMTDFSEPHTISRLIGSPPGYVGYEDEDMLVTPLRRRPSSVVLLEDIDKAHPRVLERLLRLCDEGEITDTRGLSADARQAIFIMTLTVDTAKGSNQARIGFGPDTGSKAPEREAILEKRMPQLYPVLKGHIDAFIPFQDLTEEDDEHLVEALTARYLTDLTNRLQEEYGVTLTWTPEATAKLRRSSKEAGQAPSSEFFQSQIIELLTDALLEGQIVQGNTIRLDVSDEDQSLKLLINP